MIIINLAAMFRMALKKVVPKSTVMQVANYQHNVKSHALLNIDGLCDQYCMVPRVPPQKVTILGAASDIGRIVSLFLKQQKVVKLLALWDEVPERGLLGVATDLAHIDTSTAVAAYQGRMYLKKALHDSDVVVICGGCHVMPPCCNNPDRDLFFKNMRFVRTATIACAHFCPQAVIAVQTPPVDCNFALCKYTLELAKVYDKRRVLGVNSINAMRANQLICTATGNDPATSSTPVVCGSGRCTRVPVFSSAKASNYPQAQVECLTQLVREADDIICKVKSNNEQGHLSIGFSTARCVLNIMKGLFEKSALIDSALVEQADPGRCLRYEDMRDPSYHGKGRHCRICHTHTQRIRNETS
ncbi:hypothetical protein ACJJTC_009097 [Scirpophaga incertulas]